MRNDLPRGRRDAPPEVFQRCFRLLRESIEHGIAAADSQAAGPQSAGLLDWARAYLPEHVRLPPSRMHRWLAGQLDEMQAARGRKLNVVGPRGGAKSTIGSLAFVLRAAVEAREPYIWIVSDAKHQAVSHLENLKSELRDNPRLMAAYPRAVEPGQIWRENTVRLANGVTIEAFGTGQRIRGRRRRADRPTLIVCDDIQDDRHIESSLARDHSRRWFHGMLMKAGTKRTNIVNLATALHREALAMELHTTPGWTSRIFQAIERWPDRMDLWDQWERLYADIDRQDARQVAHDFYDAHQAGMDTGAVLLWPEEEDLYTLMRMRIEGGRTAFEREKQNVPINPELCEWPESYFGDWLWFDRWPDAAQVKVLALDPSKGSESGRGDYSAFAMLAVDRLGMLYVDADLVRRPTPQIVADGVDLCRRFRPDIFGIEANQFQELLGGEFAAELARQKLIGIAPWAIENRVNKQTRIRRLGPYLSNRRIKFRSGSPGTRLLVEQQKLAVGLKRYRAVTNQLDRPPEWSDFLDKADGGLASTAKLAVETPASRAARKEAVDTLIQQRAEDFRSVRNTGSVPGNKPQSPPLSKPVGIPEGLLQHAGNTPPEFRAAVESGLRRVDPAILNRLKETGVTIKTADTLAELRPDMMDERPQGWPAGTTWKNVPAFYDPNRRDLAMFHRAEEEGVPGNMVVTSDPQALLLHEIGHAVDDLGMLSETREFLQAYRNDLAALSREDRIQFEYYVQTGNAGPSEAFAEGFAVSQGDARSGVLRFGEKFPNTLKAIQRAITGMRP